MIAVSIERRDKLWRGRYLKILLSSYAVRFVRRTLVEGSVLERCNVTSVTSSVKIIPIDYASSRTLKTEGVHKLISAMINYTKDNTTRSLEPPD